MSKRIFKYEGNGSESESRSLAEFLKEAKGAENPFNYIVEADDQSAAGIVGRVNSGNALPGDQALFDQWSGDFDQCGSCPCDGMSETTCAMFAARDEAPDDDNCDQPVDCRGVCGGDYMEDHNGACCQEIDKLEACDGNCFGPTTAAEHCPNSLVSVHRYSNKIKCVANDPNTCDCSGEYASVEACIAGETASEESSGANRPVS